MPGNMHNIKSTDSKPKTASNLIGKNYSFKINYENAMYKKLQHPEIVNLL